MAVMLGSASFAPTCTEQELISGARHGDDRAFEELYARYGERIAIFIRGRIRDHGRAEDLAQEVFISALRRLRSSEQSIAFKPWIYEIAKNACIDEHRRSQRSREVSLDGDAELSGGRGALLSIAPTPPAAMESKQRLDDLRGAFGGLSESHHQLLVMREFEGLSYDEIGQRIGMSRQMVESALFRARRKLGAEYGELASGRRCQQVQTAIESGKLTSQRSLGVRERRQLSRHLAHCQPCRVTAHLAGVDDAVGRSGLGAKIAGLLPFPVWRLWPFGRAARAAAVAGSQSGLPALSGAAEPGVSTLLGGAAIAVAALAIAGSGSIGGPLHHAGRPVHPAIPALTSAPLGVAPSLEPRPQVRSAPPVVIARPRMERPSRFSSLPRSAPVTHFASGSARVRGSAPAISVPLSAPARPGASSSTLGAVTKVATARAQPVVQGTTNNLGKTLAQSPVLKKVSQVLGAAPILRPASGVIRRIPSAVSGTAKKLTSAVGRLLGH
ncbi:MAG: sigma-70 family RNA polymerase sigma factor [Solirubrobacteraceae bacterium]